MPSHRVPRHVTPAPPERVVVLDRPPAPADTTAAGGFVQVVLPALGGVGMVLFLIAGANPLLLVAGLVMLVVTVGGAVGMYVSTRSGTRRRLVLARERYLRHLDEVRAELREDTLRRRRHDEDAHPDPLALLSRVCAGEVLLRNASDADARSLRLGVGTVPHPVRVALPEGDTDPVTARAMASLARAHRVLPGAPLCLDPADGDVCLRGAAADVRALVRGVLLQATAASRPERLRLAIVTRDPGAYVWARWLPHLLAEDGHLRLHPVAPGTRATTSAADEGLGRTGPEGVLDLIVVEHHDGDVPTDLRPARGTAGSAGSGLTATDASGTGAASGDRWVLHLLLDDGGHATERAESAAPTEVVVGPGAAEVTVLQAGAVRRQGTGDPLDAATAESMARALAARSHTPAPEGETATGPLPPARVLGVDDVSTFDPVATWARPTGESDLLTVVLGQDTHGRELRLDLKESGHGGSGPHGVLVGATGSGKSELLRSMVLGLAGTHHPDDLAFVLVDYKGGATFSGLEALPHVAGVVTNLGDDLGLVDRMHTALVGEIGRRQQVLHDAGHLNDVYAYRAARAAGRPGCQAPLPHLLVVIDEFAELLTAVPDIHDLFTTIGRIGRSIGIHQLLASQRLDDGRLRGLEAFLSYRIALRTFTAEESRAVIGSAAAAELPSTPGVGFLRTDTTRRFSAAYVSAPQAGVRRAAAPVEVVDWLPRPAETGTRGRRTTGGVTVLDAAVARMTGAAPRTRPVWLPPLPELITVEDLLAAHPSPPPYVARMGLVDLPAEQRTAPLDLDLRRGAGHLAVLGGPDTGRSSALRTLAYALATHHPVEEFVVHGIDLDGDALRPLEDLPHTGSLAGRRDEELLRRILRETLREIDRRTPVRRPDQPEVLLLVDGYGTLRTRDELHEQVLAILTRGADVGVHVALSASRWHDLRPPVQTALHGRLELRLADPIDSVVDRRLAEHLPADLPGRALVAAGSIAQLAVAGEGTEAEREACRALRRRWSGQARPVPLLPADLRLGDLLDRVRSVEPDPTRPAEEREAVRWWVGIDEDDLAPVGIGPDGPHLLVLGDRRSGRTSLLRTILRQCLEEDSTVLAVLDPRRTLIDDVPADRLAAYASTGEDAAGVLHSLAEELRSRASSGAVAGRIVLVVDDAELLAGGLDPLGPLEPHLARADDLGFSLVLARHSGGAGRALYDPVLARVKELGCPGLLLSGDPEEGPLWPGAPMRPLPPGRAVLARRGQAPTLCHLARP